MPVSTATYREEPSSGAVAAILGGLQPAFDAIEWIDRLGRAGVGRLTGLEGTGPETRLGTSPTPEELFEYISGARLPENIKGQPEWRDVPGVMTDILVSPFNVLGAGALTKAGKATKLAMKVSKRGEALRSMTRGVKEAAELDRRLASLAAKGPMGENFIKQAMRGERSLLSLHVPFSKIDIPLLPRAVSAAGLAPFSAAGWAARGVGRRIPGLEAVSKQFRVGGRLSTWLRKGEDRDMAELFNEMIGAGPEDMRRRWRGIGQAKREQISKFLAGRSLAGDRAAISGLADIIGGGLDEVIRKHPHMVKIQRRIWDAEQSLDHARRMHDTWAFEKADLRLMRAEEAFAKKEARLLRTFDWRRGLPEAEPGHALMMTGLHARTAPARLAALAVKKADDYGLKIAKWQQVLENTTDPKLQQKIQNTISKLQTNKVDEIAGLAVEGKLKQSVWDALPDDIRREVTRIDSLQGGVLDLERMRGWSPELGDAHIGYYHRALTPEGLAFSRALERLNITDNPFSDFWNKYTTVTDFTKRRTPGWEGMLPTQVNHDCHEFADQLRKTLPENLRGEIKFGLNKADKFVIEDVGAR